MLAIKPRVVLKLVVFLAGDCHAGYGSAGLS